MQRGLAVTNLSDPDPPAAWQWFFGSHPTAAAAGGDGAGLGTAGATAVNRTLVVTNDFPPRQGGIQTFVAALLARRPPESLVVLASRPRRARPSTTPRCRTRWSAQPTGHAAADPRRAARAAVDLARRLRLRQRLLRRRGARSGCSPPRCAQAGRRHLVGATHGHETGWVALPGGRQADAPHRRGARRRHLHQRVHAGRLAPALADRTRLAQLSPGRGRRRGSPRTPTAPRSGGGYGLGDAPVVVCVSRLVRAQGPGRAGRAAGRGCWPGIPARGCCWSAAARSRRRCAAPSQRGDWRDSVVFTGPVPGEELPAHYAAGDVFAMPCRTRRAGLDVEGLGHGLPRGRRLRAARGRRHVRRRAGGRAGGRHRPRRRPAVARRRGRRRSPACSTTRRARGRWARPAAPGSSSAGPGRRSPRPSPTCSRSPDTALSPAPRMRDGARPLAGRRASQRA